MPLAGPLEEGCQGSRRGVSDQSRGGRGRQKRQDTAVRQPAQHLEQFGKGQVHGGMQPVDGRCPLADLLGAKPGQVAQGRQVVVQRREREQGLGG